jgi:hypothetical protein
MPGGAWTNDRLLGEGFTATSTIEPVLGRPALVVRTTLCHVRVWKLLRHNLALRPFT